MINEIIEATMLVTQSVNQSRNGGSDERDISRIDFKTPLTPNISYISIGKPELNDVGSPFMALVFFPSVFER